MSEQAVVAKGKKLWSVSVNGVSFVAGKLSGSMSILRERVEVLVFDLALLPVEIVMHLALHGLSQKIKDCVAGQEKKGATVEMQTGDMKKVWEALVASTWTTRKAKEEALTLRGGVKKILASALPKKEEAAKIEMLFSLFGVATVHQAMVEQLRGELEKEEQEEGF